MKQLLTETCILFVKILIKLRAEGKITVEQYEEHIKLKLEFLAKI